MITRQRRKNNNINDEEMSKKIIEKNRLYKRNVKIIYINRSKEKGNMVRAT